MSAEGVQSYNSSPRPKTNQNSSAQIRKNNHSIGISNPIDLKEQLKSRYENRRRASYHNNTTVNDKIAKNKQFQVNQAANAHITHNPLKENNNHREKQQSIHHYTHISEIENEERNLFNQTKYQTSNSYNINDYKQDSSAVKFRTGGTENINNNNLSSTAVFYNNIEPEIPYSLPKTAVTRRESFGQRENRNRDHSLNSRLSHINRERAAAAANNEGIRNRRDLSAGHVRYSDRSIKRTEKSTGENTPIKVAAPNQNFNNFDRSPHKRFIISPKNSPKEVRDKNANKRNPSPSVILREGKTSANIAQRRSAAMSQIQTQYNIKYNDPDGTNGGLFGTAETFLQDLEIQNLPAPPPKPVSAQEQQRSRNAANISRNSSRSTASNGTPSTPHSIRGASGNSPKSRKHKRSSGSGKKQPVNVRVRLIKNILSNFRLNHTIFTNINFSGKPRTSLQHFIFLITIIINKMNFFI